jgi:hypothetical protein
VIAQLTSIVIGLAMLSAWAIVSWQPDPEPRCIATRKTERLIYSPGYRGRFTYKPVMVESCAVEERQ